MTLPVWTSTSEQVYLASAGPDTTALNSLAEAAGDFQPISLKEMDAAALLNRVDTKYILTTRDLFSAVRAVKNDYRILSVKGRRLNHYRTLYFDTPDFDLYSLHVNDRADRYKVRSRQYTDSNLSYLEVKHHTPLDRTIKDRIATPAQLTEMTGEALDWLEGVFPYNGRALVPQLWNTFTRLTLVSRTCCERVTLDVDLAFYAGERMVRMDGLAVAEVKTEQARQRSAFASQLRSLRIRPGSFSKYCIGVASLYSAVKKNTMKPKLLSMQKLCGGFIYYE